MHRATQLVSQLQLQPTASSKQGSTPDNVNHWQQPFTFDSKTNVLTALPTAEELHIPLKPLHEVVMEHWDRWADKPMFIDPAANEQITYAEAKEQVFLFATALHKAGVKKGEVIATITLNCIQFPLLMWAASVIGAVVSPCNPIFGPEDFSKQMTDSQAKYIFTHTKLTDVVKKSVELYKGSIKKVWYFDGKGDSSYQSLIKSTNRQVNVPKVKLDYKNDMLMLPYSSGTTGLPKGTQLTHYSMIACILQIQAGTNYRNDENDTILSILPMFHIYGMQCVCNAAPRRGSTTVIMSAFEPQLFLNSIGKYKVTMMPLVPPIVLFLAKSPLALKADFSSVRLVGSGAAPMTSELEEEFRGRFKHVFLQQGYGMTETSAVTHVIPYKRTKPASVGVLIPGMKCKIVHPETGKALGPGEKNIGEICVAGPNIMYGYLGNEKATRETIDKDGYLHTGDIGYADEEGYYFVVDRIKELIKVKGFQVAPAELEGMLLSHPDVADVAVIPIPDDRAGEYPRAYIVRKEGTKVSEKEIYDFVAKKVVAYKKLEGGVKFIDAIPKAASGKILRRVLRDEAAKERK